LLGLLDEALRFIQSKKKTTKEAKQQPGKEKREETSKEGRLPANNSNRGEKQRTNRLSKSKVTIFKSVKKAMRPLAKSSTAGHHFRQGATTL